MSCVDEAPEGHRALQPLRHRGGHQGSHRQGLHYTYIPGGGYGVHALVPRWGPIFYCSLYYYDYYQVFTSYIGEGIKFNVGRRLFNGRINCPGMVCWAWGPDCTVRRLFNGRIICLGMVRWAWGPDCTVQRLFNG